MTSIDDLNAMVVREPHVDLHRLKLADKLEETDVPANVARAKFIRLQIEIAEIERDCSCGRCVSRRGGGQCTNGPCAVDRHRIEQPDGTSKQAFLRLRERELLEVDGSVGSPNWLKWLPDEWLVHAADNPVVYDPVLIYHRGFPNRLECTVAEFMDGLCDYCNGTGFGTSLKPAVVGAQSIPKKTCRECHGTGTTPGLSRTLFATQPVTRVALTDRRPFSNFKNNGTYEYGYESHDEGGAKGTGMIPPELFDRLANYYRSPNRYRKWYHTAEDALAALSAAAVNSARELHGYDPI